MTKVTVLPHETLCPNGLEITDVEPNETICQVLLRNGVAIEHACEMSCACTTCHVIIREGLQSLAPAEDDEEDMLDRAWGLTAQSRLSCQAKIAQQDLVVEIPKYTINHARE